jgi:hypothetical protein
MQKAAGNRGIGALDRQFIQSFLSKKGSAPNFERKQNAFGVEIKASHGLAIFGCEMTSRKFGPSDSTRAHSLLNTSRSRMAN